MTTQPQMPSRAGGAAERPIEVFCDECWVQIPASAFSGHRESCVYPTPADIGRWQETVVTSNFPYRPCPLCVAVLETRDSDIWVHGETGDTTCHAPRRAGSQS